MPRPAAHRLAAGAALLLAAALPSAQARTMTYSNATTTVLSAPADLSATSVVQTGPETAAPAFDELVPSWNARTPAGGSVTLEVRARLGGGPDGGWTRFYSFGTWTRADGRSSLEGQRDAQGALDTDTLSLRGPASAYQYRVTLRGGATLSLLAFTTSRRARRLEGAGAASDRLAWGTVLDVPQRSQMIYPGGGENWCSPTSTSMILKFWGVDVTVPQAAAGTYDAAYDGTGNWPFNAAYAGSLGLRAYVSRLPSLAAAEGFIRAGVPLAVSLGWKAGELPGAALPTSSGHLMVLVGFNQSGDPVLNDPAAPADSAVRRAYPRAAFERLWLSHSGGLAYVMALPLTALPGSALP